MRPEIELISAVSRLIDAHDTKRKLGAPLFQVSAPNIDLENASNHLEISLCILDVLNELDEGSSDLLHPKVEISFQVKKKFPKADDIDIDYCLRLLSQARDIHYFPEDADKPTTTRATQLIERPRGDYEQYRLTEASRILFKVNSLKREWLYEDLDTEKIIRALEKSQFESVGPLCAERQRNMDALSKLLTKIEEHTVSFSDVFTTKNEFDSIKTTTAASLEITKKAAGMLRSDPATESRIKEWCDERGINANEFRSQLLQDCMKINRAIDGISRRIDRFVKSLKSMLGKAVAVRNFMSIAEELATRPRDLEIIESYLHKMIPIVIEDNFFAPSDFIESVDLCDYQPKALPDYACTDMSRYVEEEKVYMTSFLARNRKWIVDRLKKGPITFQQILETGEFEIQSGENLSHFFGVYAIIDDFGETVRIAVGITGNKTKYRDDSLEITGDNPVLFLIDEVNT